MTDDQEQKTFANILAAHGLKCSYLPGSDSYTIRTNEGVSVECNIPRLGSVEVTNLAGSNLVTPEQLAQFKESQPDLYAALSRLEASVPVLERGRVRTTRMV
jgi:hypothetical protein